MPRKPRFYLPGVPAHVMQRGHNRGAIFFAEKDYLEYLKILRKVSSHYQCLIHAYVLMTNHIHLLVTPLQEKSISLMFQALGRDYVTYINKTYQRSGTLWEGRHRGNIIDAEHYFLNCMRYIEFNPVRANMVRSVEDYPWSSYAANGLGDSNAIITPHTLYLSLSEKNDKNERLNRYQGLFHSNPTVKQEEFEASILSGTPLGSKVFLGRVEKQLNCPIGYISQGRPKIK